MPRSRHPRSNLPQRGRPAPDLDRIAADLNHIYVRGGLQTVIAVGTVILEEFFGGDITAFRHRQPGSWGSFRELCARDDLAMSRSYLAVCMDILVQLDDLPTEIGRQLSFTHHRTLLPVKDLQVKRRLARRTVHETLSSRGLRGLVQQEIGRSGRAGGPRPLSPADRALRRMEAACRKLDEETGDEGCWDRLAPSEQEDLAASLSAVIRRVERVRRRLGDEP